jgi:hypothetical protein
MTSLIKTITSVLKTDHITNIPALKASTDHITNIPALKASTDHITNIPARPIGLTEIVAIMFVSTFKMAIIFPVS